MKNKKKGRAHKMINKNEKVLVNKNKWPAIKSNLMVVVQSTLSNGSKWKHSQAINSNRE